MYALMERYYEGCERAQFERDLAEKQYVLRLFDAEGGLCGFSTIQLLEFEHGGRRAVCVFSGDTVIDRACWGQKRLQRAFAAFLLRLRLSRRGRVYWFLISKGYKTYLFMRHNLRSYPNHAEETPPEVQAVLDRVARLKYPENYDPVRGVISFAGPAQAVREVHRDLEAKDLADPDIRFFVERNPGYARGDELCCLAEVTLRGVAYGLWRYGVLHPLRRLFGREARPRGGVSAPGATASAPRG
ncbi:MAG: hypothetical protein D6731_24300 [Planctomycetota bacterium]|nr:MAG: hypothetical protein D6731_24300 [Planctomycetota bacterium]